MKKLLSVLAATSMIVSLAACGSSAPAPTTAAATTAAATEAATTAAAAAAETQAAAAAETQAAAAADTSAAANDPGGFRIGKTVIYHVIHNILIFFVIHDYQSFSPVV